MKKAFYLLLLLIGMSVSTYAQNKIPAGIPKRVYYMQISKFPAGADLAWRVLADSTYTVTFKVNGKAGFAHYDRNSADIETHMESDSASLPRAVLHTVDSLYRGYRYLSGGHFLTSAPLQNEEVFLKYAHDYYQVVLTKEKNTYKLYFSPEGNLLNRIERKIGK